MSNRYPVLYDEFVSKKNYDVRISNNGRWIDQKCTPDILALVADSLVNYAEDKGTDEVTSIDLWHYDYSRTLLINIFKKVDPNSAAAENEYDKVFQQPLKMLANAGILCESRLGRRITFKIVRKDILETLIYEMNSLEFITSYVEKVLRDSGIWDVFDNFFKKQDNDAYYLMKREFERFTFKNTPIKNLNECRRIFTKVLNPLAFKENKLGTEKGRLSTNVIQRGDLMYNRYNFRDLKKPKDITRKEYATYNSTNFSSNFKYMSDKEKKFVKSYNEEHNCGKSELACDEECASLQIHHMFMASEYPEFSYYRENLIALTPTQHLSYAHPNNDTNRIDPKYRCKLLLCKLNTIMIDNNNDINEYDIEKFKEILAVGFSDDSFKELDGKDYDSIKEKIKEICKTKYNYEQYA